MRARAPGGTNPGRRVAVATDFCKVAPCMGPEFGCCLMSIWTPGILRWPLDVSSRLKLGNAGYHLMQNLLSSSLLSKNLKVKIYKTIIFLLFCMGLELGRSHLRRNIG